MAAGWGACGRRTRGRHPLCLRALPAVLQHSPLRPLPSPSLYRRRAMSDGCATLWVAPLSSAPGPRVAVASAPCLQGLGRARQPVGTHYQQDVSPAHRHTKQPTGGPDRSSASRARVEERAQATLGQGTRARESGDGTRAVASRLEPGNATHTSGGAERGVGAEGAGRTDRAQSETRDRVEL